MLAYSSISHAGFMLIAIAANNALGGRALLYYLIPYCAMSVGSFAVVAARERELNRPVTLENLAGFGWERPLLGVAMTVFMLGFAGFPLTGGFVGKFYALLRRVRARLDLARDRRRRRDGGQPLLLPRRDPRDVHAALGGAAAARRSAGGSPPRELAAADRGRRRRSSVTVGSFFAVAAADRRSRSTPTEVALF